MKHLLNKFNTWMKKPLSTTMTLYLLTGTFLYALLSLGILMGMMFALEPLLSLGAFTGLLVAYILYPAISITCTDTKKSLDNQE
jgi:hypothetical protein